MPLLSINKLNYKIGDKKTFNDFNFDIDYNSFISIIAPNQSGKTLLTKLLCAIIPTFDMCYLDGISLNKENVLYYIKKIGIVTNDFRNPFLHKKVKDELIYPLSNLGYSSYKINNIIYDKMHYFDIDYLIDKNISSLNKSEKSKLKIVLALLHNPKLLVLDDAFNDMNSSDQIFMINKLKELVSDDLSILNITSKLDTIYNSDIIYIMNNYKIEKSFTLEKLFDNSSYLTKIGLEIPFIVDLSIKLKLYGVIDKIYFNIEELGEELWK